MTSLHLFGEGDFRFTLAAAKAITAPSTIIATSYDDASALSRKYQDISSTLAKMRVKPTITSTSPSKKRQKLSSKTSISKAKALHNIKIVHSIDCTKPSTYTHLLPSSKPIDHVIFNHPHLGVENRNDEHHQLLTHLFHEFVGVFCQLNDACNLHITLLERQFERWRVPEALSKVQNLKLVHTRDFAPPGDFETFRRGKNGKSFSNSNNGGGLKSITYSFALSIAAKQLLPWETATATTTTTTTPNNLELAFEFECEFCEKSFKEARSLKSHVTNCHNDNSLELNILRCEICDRSFKTKDAFDQHNIAKHTGAYTNVKPGWVKSTTTKLEHPDPVCCNICKMICGDNFIPHDDFEAVQNFSCSFCEKTFTDERGLKQHSNKCQKV